MAGVKSTITTTVEASWDIKGINPTISEWLKIANDIKFLDIPKTLELRIERSMSENESHKVVMEKHVAESQPTTPVYRAEKKPVSNV